VDASDPINGPLSFMFSDWKGNVYGEGNPHENQPTEDKNLDNLWQGYLLASAKDGSTPLGRWEWMEAAMAVDESDEGFDFTEESLDEGTMAAVNDEIIKTANVTQSELPKDSDGNVVELDSSIATFDSDSNSWNLGKDASEMNNMERDQALAAIGTDDAAFYDVLFSMESSDMDRFLQGASQTKLDDMKKAGILPGSTSDYEVTTNSTKGDLAEQGIKSGNIIMEDGNWYMIDEVERRKDVEGGDDEFYVYVEGRKIDPATGKVDETPTDLWSDKTSGYDDFDEVSWRTTADESDKTGYTGVHGGGEYDNDTTSKSSDWW
jgi:hypothetical protein